MSEKPKPTTGEWMVEKGALVDPTGFSYEMTTHMAKALAKAIHAALAADREKVKEAEAEQKATEAGYDMIAAENKQLRSQLAACSAATGLNSKSVLDAAIAEAQKPLVDGIELMFQAHTCRCDQCSSDDDGCEEGQRLEEIKLNALAKVKEGK